MRFVLLLTCLTLSLASCASNKACVPWEVFDDYILLKNETICVTFGQVTAKAFNSFSCRVYVKNLSDSTTNIIIRGVFLHSVNDQIIKMLTEPESDSLRNQFPWRYTPEDKQRDIDALSPLKLVYAKSYILQPDELIAMEFMFPWNDSLEVMYRGTNMVLVDGYFDSRRVTPFPNILWDAKKAQEAYEAKRNKQVKYHE